MQTGPQQNILSPSYMSLFFSVKFINIEHLVYLLAHCSLLTIRVQPLENKRKNMIHSNSKLLATCWINKLRLKKEFYHNNNNEVKKESEDKMKEGSKIFF